MEMQSTGTGIATASLVGKNFSLDSEEYRDLPNDFVISPCGVLKQKVQRAAEFAPQNNGSHFTKEPNWKELHRAAFQSMLRRDFSTAEKNWLEALRLLEFAPYTDHRLEETLDCLVETYRLQNNFGQAIRHCLFALEVKRISYDNWSVHVAACLNKLAGLYYSSHHYDKVESLCREAEQIYLKIDGTNSKNMGTIATNLAIFYHSQNKSELAEKRYLQALKIKTALLPEGHPELTALRCRYDNLVSSPVD